MQRMDNFQLPIFNIESEDEEEESISLEASKGKIIGSECHPLHKLLSYRSINPPGKNPNLILKKLESIAEDNLLKKELVEMNCTLPGNPRSTFLMVFSPDGSKVASSHGDHNIYVTDLCSNKCISTLSGHPRTPWCIAFHPHRNDMLASGCLGGQVRVWDLHGGSEVWSVTAIEVTTVIASLAFHPSERLLVIATNSTLYFWDWNIPQPFAKCSTANEKQKLRYVCFDPLGNWLLTGISNSPGTSSYIPASTTAVGTNTNLPPATGQLPSGIPGIYRTERNEQERERNLQNRYQTLLDQYERLRVRYQELRFRAAELEFNATNNNGSGSSANGANLTATLEPQGESSINPPLDVRAGSSSDRFWRMLMNVTESLRALSSIGRSLSSTTRPTSGAATSSRSSGPSLDHDARIRIQLLSRHIENMQRICRSHLEMTRHRRQVYRLQQIRRILEDLREQIRYLQVCVRDSLDLMSQLRTSAPPPAPSASSSGSLTNSGGVFGAVPRLVDTASQSDSTSASGESSNQQRSYQEGPRPYTPLQCRRFAHYLAGRIRRIGMQHQRDQHQPRLRRYRPTLHEGRNLIRRLNLRSDRLGSPSATLADPEEPQPQTSRGETGDDLSMEPITERGLRGYSGSALARWRRTRLFRFSHRAATGPCRSNSLLHMRNNSLIIQRRKSPIFSRIFRGRLLQNQLRSATNYNLSGVAFSPSVSSEPPTQESGSRSNDQSLRPLMERLESHFRLQRQTMGILAQLNEATSANANTSSSFSDSGVSSRPWTSDADQYPSSIRDWRSGRESTERAHSLDSRSSSNDRFQMPRRVDATLDFGVQSRYRTFPALVDEDSSDTDTDITNETSGSNRWRQSSPIRSPRGVEQRMRLLWREYLSQVVHAQNSATENQQGGDADNNADQERIRYRLWLSTMVESLTSFFSQHGINSSESDAPPRSSPAPSASDLRNNNGVGSAGVFNSNNNNAGDQQSSRIVVSPPWRALPRVMEQSGAGGAVAAEGYGGTSRIWNIRRNAESQVSLSAHLSLTYRIQAWDFRHGFIPDIRDPHINVVVPESKIHNDASVDVSGDGRFLVTLVPCTSLTGALISLHSLEPSSLGDCLAQVNVDQFVVSVSISPTSCHLLLGLASSRALSVAQRDVISPTLWAQVYKIPPKNVHVLPRNSTDSSRSERKVTSPQPMMHVRNIDQTMDVGMTSLNCIRWIPMAGQGFVLGTNKGHLKVIH